MRFTRHHIAVRGFTLLELIIVMVLLGFLAAIGSQMIYGTMNTSSITAYNQVSGSEGRYAVERMTREIREIAYTSSGYDTSTHTATTFTFNKEDGTAVTITNSGTSLTLGYNPGTTSTLTNSISSGTFAFAYLDQLGGVTTDPDDMRFVQISMTVTNAVTGTTESLRNRVFFRNAQSSP